jgi:S1-C subfamily serine protease
LENGIFERKNFERDVKSAKKRFWARAKNAILVAAAGAMLAVEPPSSVVPMSAAPPPVRESATLAGMENNGLRGDLRDLNVMVELLLHPSNDEEQEIFREFENMSLSEERRVERLVERLRRSTVQIESDEAIGSGVIIRKSGDISIILTNRHVVEAEDGLYGAPNLVVKNGELTARPFGILLGPHELDLAIIVVNDDIGPAVNIARRRPRQGANVLVLGSPLGIEDTLTRGVVSNFRTRTTDSGFEYEAIQTDAAINPGNSGGGLFHARSGELLGIPAFKRLLNPIVPAEGIAYAIPARLLYQLPLRDWESIPVSGQAVALAD